MATFKEKTEILEYLRANGKKIGEGLYQFNDGWSDAKIAAIVSTKGNVIKTNVVARVRNQMLGQVPKKTTIEPHSRMKDLHDKIMRLEDKLTDLRAGTYVFASRIVESHNNLQNSFNSLCNFFVEVQNTPAIKRYVINDNKVLRARDVLKENKENNAQPAPIKDTLAVFQGQ